MTSRPSRCVVLVACTALLSGAARAQWPEPDGPLHTRWVPDVRAPKNAPEVRWRAGFHELVSAPVVSEGVAYVVARAGGDHDLVLVRVSDGERFARVRIPEAEFAHVSVLNSTIVVVNATSLRVFRRRGDALRKGRVVRGDFRSAASLLPGLAAVATPEGLSVVSLSTGRTIHESAGAEVKPLVHGRESARATVWTLESAAHASNATKATFRNRSLVKVELDDVGSSQPTARATRPVRYSGSFRPELQEPELVGLHISGRRPSPMVVADHWTRAGRRYLVPSGGGTSLTIDADLCVLDGTLYGRDRAGNLLGNTLLGTEAELIPRRDRPAGALDAPLSAAGSVLLLGNWALDIESERVLWCAPALDVAGPLVPAGDGVVVFEAKDGDLVCAAEVVESTTAASAAPGVVAELPEPERPTRPGSGNAVILRSGVRIEGKARRVGSSVVLLPDAPGAKALRLSASDVAAVENNQALEVVADSFPVSLAVRDHVERELATSLADAVAGYARRDLVAEARRLLHEVRERGLPPAELRLLEEELAGRRESTRGNRGKQLEAVRRDEHAAREAALEASLDAAAWLAGHGLDLEAGDVLSRTLDHWPRRRLDATSRERVVEAAAGLVPPAFPTRWGSDRTEQWLEWVRELAPAGGRFVEAPDGLALRGPWRTETIVLQTDNLTVLTRSRDPEVVGACLRHGEGAVRTLADVLDLAPRAGDARMEVRIHANRADYLTEDLGGGRVPTWSLGLYVPALRASRFYVPDVRDRSEQSRELHEVVAHELTHQFIEERWLPAAGDRRDPDTPGFWIVEGFARFIEDQSLELGRRGHRLDDATVQSVESAAGLDDQGRAIPTSSLVRATQQEFLRLPDEPIAKVDLRSTLGSVVHTGKSAFYDQAGALVFFMMNRRGVDGRERLIEALAAHYRGVTNRAGWEALGFPSAESLERALERFFDTL